MKTTGVSNTGKPTYNPRIPLRIPRVASLATYVYNVWLASFIYFMQIRIASRMFFMLGMGSKRLHNFPMDATSGEIVWFFSERQ